MKLYIIVKATDVYNKLPLKVVSSSLSLIIMDVSKARSQINHITTLLPHKHVGHEERGKSQNLFTCKISNT